MAVATALSLGSLLGSQTGRIAVGGHRGCGENLLNKLGQVVPVYRENTVRSFLRAAELGASFVEFDVQVTKDLVPVIWHDDQVIASAGSGSSREPPAGSSTELRHHSACEVKELTLLEFQAMVEQPLPGLWSTPLLREFRGKESRAPLPGVRAWPSEQDDVLPTLQAVFEAVPPSIGFDIEVKMTTGEDVEVTPAEEVDRMVGAILEVVERMTAAQEGGAAPQRTIMFSSFDPDVCVELRKRQSSFPVMYLSGCGLYRHVDKRRTSIQAAIDWAADHQLAGIVLPTCILTAHTHLVQDARERGLLVLTYGLENDDLEAIRLQAALGVHAAIVDDMQGVLPQLMAAAGAGK